MFYVHHEEVEKSQETVERWAGYAGGWSALKFSDGLLLVEVVERELSGSDARLEGLVVITASNPGGKGLGFEENRIRREALLARLQTCADETIETLGGHKETSWRDGGEEGFAVRISREEAVLIAADFEQEAVYVFENGMRTLLPVDSLPCHEGFYRVSAY